MTFYRKISPPPHTTATIRRSVEKLFLRTGRWIIGSIALLHYDLNGGF